MSGIDKPLFLVTMKDQWVTHKSLLTAHIAVPAFGTRDDAEKFLKESARESRMPIRYYRIVEFACVDVLAGKS